LLESSKYLDDATDRAYSHEDDEYARANEIEPKVDGCFYSIITILQ